VPNLPPVDPAVADPMETSFNGAGGEIEAHVGPPGLLVDLACEVLERRGRAFPTQRPLPAAWPSGSRCTANGGRDDIGGFEGKSQTGAPVPGDTNAG